jgi:hypothetical protein
MNYEEILDFPIEENAMYARGSMLVEKYQLV